MPDQTLILTLPCQTCGQQTPTGMWFCLRCGAETESKQAKRPVTVECLCPNCNSLDEYSVSFCITCGKKLDLPAAATSAVVAATAQAQGQGKVKGLGQGQGQAIPKLAPSRRKTFCWKKPDAPLAKVEALRRLDKTELAEEKVISPLAIAVALILGGFLGLGAWRMADGDHHFRRDLEQYHWAGHPLIVYAQPAQAQVTLEEEQSREVAYAKVRQDGLLDLPQLTPGKYRMYIESPGYKTAFGIITLEDGRPTVIGFPEPVKLLPL
jgi:DNA-directed RNA polymerase subunit RPC12/RpoP